MQLTIDKLYLLGEGSLKAFERQIIIMRNDVVGIMWKDLKLIQGFVLKSCVCVCVCVCFSVNLQIINN
jgi:hypothetical protein